MKDRPGARIDVVATVLANERTALGEGMEFRIDTATGGCQARNISRTLQRHRDRAVDKDWGRHRIAATATPLGDRIHDFRLSPKRARL